MLCNSPLSHQCHNPADHYLGTAFMSELCIAQSSTWIERLEYSVCFWAMPALWDGRGLVNDHVYLTMQEFCAI